MVISPNKPLQVVNRLKEMESPKLYHNSTKIVVSDNYNKILGLCLRKMFMNVTKNYNTTDTHLNREADRYCLTLSGKVFQICNILKKDGSLYVYGREFVSYQPFFEYPFSSIAIDVMEVKELSHFKLMSVNDILTKCLVIPCDTYTISIPMLHAPET